MRAAATGRADDQSIETIKRRLAVYHGVQTPLEEYFTENKYKIYRCVDLYGTWQPAVGCGVNLHVGMGAGSMRRRALRAWRSSCSPSPSFRWSTSAA
jgi:hypothetical protein